MKGSEHKVGGKGGGAWSNGAGPHGHYYCFDTLRRFFEMKDEKEKKFDVKKLGKGCKKCQSMYPEELFLREKTGGPDGGANVRQSM